MAENKKYLLLTADFPPIEGGIGTLSVQLAMGLNRRKQLIAAAAPKLAGGEKFDRQCDFPVLRVPGYSLGPARVIPAWFPVKDYVGEHRDEIDRVLAMNISYGGLMAAKLKRQFGLPFEVFAYGYDFLKYEKTPVFRQILLSVFRSAGRVLSISDFTTEQLIQFGVKADKIAKVSLGVDTNKFNTQINGSALRRQYGAEGLKVLLSVGRLIERKGHRQTILALPKIRNKIPAVQYWIVGRGPMKRPLKDMAQEQGVADCVKFLDYVSDEKLPQVFAACDLFVMPAMQVGGSVEGYGLVFLEAAACGKPSIGGRSGGVPEAIVEGETGLLIDKDDPDELAEKVVGILSEGRHYEQMAQAARNHAESRSLERMIDFFG